MSSSEDPSRFGYWKPIKNRDPFNWEKWLSIAAILVIMTILCLVLVFFIS